MIQNDKKSASGMTHESRELEQKRIIFEEFFRFLSLEIDRLQERLIKKEKSKNQLELEFIQKIDKLKEEFIEKIAHDLKQPLVPILWNAEILKLPETGELNDMQKECVDEIIANTNRQISMFDDLISTQKLGEMKNK